MQDINKSVTVCYVFKVCNNIYLANVLVIPALLANFSLIPVYLIVISMVYIFLYRMYYSFLLSCEIHHEYVVKKAFVIIVLWLSEYLCKYYYYIFVLL